MSNTYKTLMIPFKTAVISMLIGTLGSLSGSSLALAAEFDYFGPPPVGDPSAFTGPFIGKKFARDLLETLPPAMEGALEGGQTGTALDAGVNNAVPEDQQRTGGKFDVPTNGPPSPLFGARSFTQRMLRFEEFGTEPLDAGAPQQEMSFPVPTLGAVDGLEQDSSSVAASQPAGAALDAFLAQDGITPFPMWESNTVDLNPWQEQIGDFLGRELETPPAEGRPPGKGWSHQRWNEFYPEVFFKTAQAGSRENGGLRDDHQLHRYRVGEFGRGGLYHNTAGIPITKGTTKGIKIRFHPNMPIQDHKSLWTFDGTLPPKLLMVRNGQPVLMRHYNALPIDPSANRGFGLHTITTHEHNGHTPAESDGFTNAFFFPGQFYDSRWPMQLAGHDTINTDASDENAAFPCSAGETLFVNDANPGLRSCENGLIKIRGDWRETMSTHWFHDHMLDFTAQNVYKGNAAMMNYYSALDRGKEDLNDGVNLRFPSGTALAWGNRDYDVNLVIADKAWDQTGQLWFNIFNLGGFIGDQVLTNWLYHPYFNVRARSYRFRILNGSVSRYFALALVQKIKGIDGEIPGPTGSGISYNRVPFYMIANDGNIMEHTVPFDGSVDLDGDGQLLDNKGQLPTLAIGERYDIVVDFSKHGIKPGDRLFFVNTQEHNNGKRAGATIPLEDILSKTYKARMRLSNGLPERWVKGDPAVGIFFQLRVKAYGGIDQSMDPSEYVAGKKVMIPLTIHRDDPVDQAKLAAARHRTIEFTRSSPTDEAPWTIKIDGGGAFTADPRRISAAPQLASGPTPAGFSGDGTLEIWSLDSSSGGWSHPVHAHFEEAIILKVDGHDPPEWERWARKDMFRLGPENDGAKNIEIAMNFREFAGSYMEHCHNTQHEDRSMLLRFDVEHPGQILTMPAPMPTWDGVDFVDSAALPTFRTGDGFGL